MKSTSTSAPDRGERRQVSVLFLDVVGSTEMVRVLDPEDAQAILDDALAAFARTIAAHGGQVLQYAGDSVLAVFGAPRAREDDAERAVHAGLALLADARARAPVIRQQQGIASFDIRVGIHTGDVLLGGNADIDGAIRGFTVHVAARLEQTAPPGHLRISQATWRHVRGVFEAELQPALTVKGQDEPMTTWFVTRARPRRLRAVARGVEGVDTPLVGREAELAVLVEEVDALLGDGGDGGSGAGGGTRAVTLLADPGLGKSRLLNELRLHVDTLPRPPWLLEGRCTPGGELQPYGLLRELLAWRLDIADSDDAASARTRWLAGLAPLLGEQGPTLACALGHLVGLDFSGEAALTGLDKDPRLLRERGLAACLRWLQALAADGGAGPGVRPVVMLLDDLQWADDASLDWLEGLLGQQALPLALIVAARPTLRERRPQWGAAAAAPGAAQALVHRVIELAPLAPAARADLTAALLGRLGAVPAALRELIERQAEGNPYYAEEIVQMLIDDGVIAQQAEPADPVDPRAAPRWRFDEARLAAARVPGTLVGVLQARLDTLAADERRALQQAAVVGPVFWDAALAALDPPSEEALPSLAQRSLVLQHADSPFAGTRERAFHHHLLHQVTYDTVLKADRRAGHARAAQWLAERVADRQEEYLAVTAEHYARAGEHLHAAQWLHRAVLAASTRFANASALRLLDRARALVPPDALELRWQLGFCRQALADLRGDRDEQLAGIDECAALAEMLDDDAKRAGSLVSRALLHDRTGDPVQARGFAERAIAPALRAGDDGRAALALGELAWLAYQRQEYDAARSFVARAIAHADAAARKLLIAGDAALPVSVRLVAGYIEREANEPMRAEAHTRTAMAIARSAGQTRALVTALAGMAQQRLHLGDFEEARAIAQECLQTATAIGLVSFQGQARHVLGDLARFRGDIDAAVDHLRHAEALFAAARMPQGAGDSAENLARALNSLGRHDEADAAVQRATAWRQAHGDPQSALRGRLSAAVVQLERGQLADALAIVDGELVHPQAAAALEEGMRRPDARWDAWRVLAAAGDPREREQLAAAMATLAATCARLDQRADRERLLGHSALWPELLAAARAAGIEPLPQA
jgi:class 3 adenylate cyclase/tetratricopeptide (TPR) repeat protein